MLIAKNFKESILKSYNNIEKTIHFPGGAICFTETLPDPIFEIRRINEVIYVLNEKENAQD